MYCTKSIQHCFILFQNPLYLFLSKHTTNGQIGDIKIDKNYIETEIHRYLNHCRFEKGLDSKTIKAYRIDLLQFSAFIQKEGNSYCKENLQAHIACLHGHYKIKSVKRKIASLKAFFNYLEYEEIIDENPFSKIRVKLHEPILLPRTISLTSIDTLLRCAYQQLASQKETTYEYRTSLRDVAVLELLFATGMRVSELCSLHAEDVNLIEGIIKIYGKGSKERIIQIGNHAVLLAVESYYHAFSKEITGTGWFFINRLGKQLSDQSVRFMINKYSQAARITQHITPHVFRHSFASLLLEEDVDIRYIQQLLGHSSIVTTQIYTHVTSKKQRDILTIKHPRNKIRAKKAA